MSLLWTPLTNTLERGEAKVTAGIPGLSPAQRHARTLKDAARLKQSQAIADAHSKEAAAISADGTHPTISLDAQLGRPLHSAEFMRLLKGINPNFYFEVSNSNAQLMGLYIIQPWTNPSDPSPAHKHLKFIMGFERGIAPEFTVRKSRTEMRWNPEQEKSTPVEVFDGLIMGWRTILARLLRAHYITQADIDHAFGPPSRDSRNWQGLTT